MISITSISHQRGGCISNARRAVVNVFAAKGGIKNGARKGAVPPRWNGTSYLPRAKALNPSGRRQPVPDRPLGAQGRKARRRHQPSRRSRVNLREYRQAPPRFRSRSRPRHRRPPRQRSLSEAMQPFYTTLGTEDQRPDGCHLPLCAAGAGPYRRFPSAPRFQISQMGRIIQHVEHIHIPRIDVDL